MESRLGFATVAAPSARFHEGFQTCDFADGYKAFLFGRKFSHFFIECWQKHPLDAKAKVRKHFHC